MRVTEARKASRTFCVIEITRQSRRKKKFVPKSLPAVSTQSEGINCKSTSALNAAIAKGFLWGAYRTMFMISIRDGRNGESGGRQATTRFAVAVTGATQ